jgi:ABC-type cobalamin/Fe3+-siderophores transport system ATPase subunit
VGGEVLLDSARRVDVPAERRRLGYVPQQHALFPFLDVAGNVAFGLPRRERTAARILPLLDELGLASLASARPDALSGGERQRVFLARALVQEPRALLLDEPTTHLDLRHQATLLEVVREGIRERGLTAMAVLHDLNLAAVTCDRLVLLAGGRIVAAGAARDVLRREIIEAAFGARVHVGMHGAADAPTVLPIPPRSP